MLWREGLLQKLKKNIDGSFFAWMMEFLSSLKIQVFIGTTIYQSFETHNGIPQGSVISPRFSILWLMTSLVSSQNAFVTNLLMVLQWRNRAGISHMPKNNNNHWTGLGEFLIGAGNGASNFLGWRLKLSSFHIVFFPKAPTIQFRNCLLLIDNHTRVPGLFFDKNLTWRMHIEYLIEKI